MVRQQIVLLDAVAVKAGLLRLQPLLHSAADGLLLRYVAQADDQQLLRAHIGCGIVEHAGLEVRGLEPVEPFDHLVVALLHFREIDGGSDGSLHRLDRRAAGAVLRAEHDQQRQNAEHRYPAQSLIQLSVHGDTSSALCAPPSSTAMIRLLAQYL